MKIISKKVLSIFLTLLIILPFGAMNLSSFATNGDEMKRDIVLMLDISDSMEGTPFVVMKQAASKFCEQLMNAKGDNRVALVIWDSSYYTYSFSNDLATVKSCIENIEIGGGTNTAQALSVAKNMMDDYGREGAIKNIILLTDGIPLHGSCSYNGPYSYADFEDYEYANYAYNIAKTIPEEYSFYTLGFFHNLSGTKLSFGRKFLNDIQNAGYYEVTDPDELVFKFGEIAGDITNSLKEITFKYQSGSDYSAKCYYTNDYFAESSYTYNPSLATMSVSFAMSAFGSGNESDYENKSINAKNLLMEIGISDEKRIKTNDWFTKKPTTDSIGVIAGNMPITVNKKDYTLIALAVRGGGYEQEWASNFTIGTSGQHNGFNTAKNNVIEFLKNYISSQNINGPIKLWITGYSRAAAIANLVGGEIDKGTTLGSKISYDLSDIYTYTFETPAGALTSQVKNNSKYNNIYNIINQSDPVPYVAPAALGFGRYGIDKYLPSAQANGTNYNNLKSNMLKVYNSLGSTDDYVVDNFQMKKIAGLKNWLPGGKKISIDIQDDTKNNFSQGVFLSNYVTYLARDFIVSRDNYVTYYEDEIREICSVAFGCTDVQSKILADSFIAQAKDGWKGAIGSYIYNVGVKGLWFGSDEDAALQTISNWLLKAVQDAGIKNYNKSTIDSAGKNLGDLLLALASNHPNYLTTAIQNGSGLGAAHYPELCYSWLASMDSNYSNGAKNTLNNGGYRIIRINCAVDIEVEDENGNTVASIIDESPVEISNGCLSGVDENGQKYIILPIDEDYNVSVTGREDDLVNFGISEYCAEAGEFTRNVNYFDIDLAAGETLTGFIPTYSIDEIESDTPDGSSVNYTLYDSTNNIIECDSDISSGNCSIEYCNVSVTSSNNKYGFVNGGGVVSYGEYIQVEAYTIDGAVFDGWYIDGECVSTETTYRVCAKEDTEIVGIFDKNPSFFSRILYATMRFFQRIIYSIAGLFN